MYKLLLILLLTSVAIAEDCLNDYAYEIQSKIFELFRSQELPEYFREKFTRKRGTEFNANEIISKIQAYFDGYLSGSGVG